MKKRILIGINRLQSNSVGVSLVSFLNNVDYSRYEIDLVFSDAKTNMLYQLPKEVNIKMSPLSGKKLSLLDKFKIFRKYNFSLMYDVESTKIMEIIMLASRNNAVYLHYNYKNIYAVQSKFNNFLLKFKIFDFKKILFSNELILNSFADLFPDLSSKLFKLDYMINDKKIISLSNSHVEVDKPNYTTLLVAAGTINDRSKNYSLMIKMMSNLVKMNNHVNLWILGDGPDLVNLKMIVKQFNLNEYIKFLGFKSNPYPYMKMADYILSTSDASDSSTTILEAKVLQKPIISTSADLKNENTYVVSPDVNLISSQINEIVKNKMVYQGSNNFWVENQKVLKDFDNIINS